MATLGGAIVALIILLIGVQAVLFVTRAYIPATETLAIPETLPKALEELGNLMTIGLVVLIVVLIPVYASRRGKKAYKPSVDER